MTVSTWLAGTSLRQGGGTPPSPSAPAAGPEIVTKKENRQHVYRALPPFGAVRGTEMAAEALSCEMASSEGGDALMQHR